MILRRKRKMEAAAPLTPLIDCVFLLLIFFLVTTMLKRSEKVIPVTLPDSQLALSAEANAPLMTIGLDAEGQAYRGSRGRSRDMIRYEPVESLAVLLQEIATESGPETPIQFAVAAGTDTQTVVRALDVAKIQGFDNVAVRMRNRDF
ncbi:MAG: ExbD/TolR family protein [Opitutales bacterium]